MQVAVGDIVKSFDFNGDNSCYIIGEVININDSLLEIRAIKRVFGDMPAKAASETYMVPMQGSMMMDTNAFQRIVVLG